MKIEAIRTIPCEHMYCIYNKDDICTLDSIELDVSGLCRACILLYLPKGLLDGLKERQRKLDNL